MDATTDFDLEEVRREIAARSSVSPWDFILGHNKFLFFLNRVALRLSQSSALFFLALYAILASN